MFPLLWVAIAQIESLRKTLDNVQGLLDLEKRECEALQESIDQDVEEYNSGFDAAEEGKPLPKECSDSFRDGYRVKRCSILELELNRLRKALPETLDYEGKISGLVSEVEKIRKDLELARSSEKQAATSLKEKQEAIVVLEEAQQEWMQNFINASKELRVREDEEKALRAKIDAFERTVDRQERIGLLGSSTKHLFKGIVEWANKQGIDEIGIAEIFDLDVPTLKVLLETLKE